MRYFMFSVFDNATQVYCPPFIAATVSSALRDFAFAANDASTNIGKYPTDYTLFSVGEYDDQSGEIIPQVHKSLGLAASYVKQPEVTEDGI